MILRKSISKYSSCLMCTLWWLSRELAHIKHANFVLSSNFKVYYLSSHITCVCVHVYEGHEHVRHLCVHACAGQKATLNVTSLGGKGVTSLVRSSTGLGNLAGQVTQGVCLSLPPWNRIMTIYHHTFLLKIWILRIYPRFWFWLNEALYPLNNLPSQ